MSTTSDDRSTEAAPDSPHRDLQLKLGAELNALLSASRALTERSSAAFHPELRPAAFHLARWLYAYGAARPSVLADAVAMDRSSTSSLIRRMKALGLVTSSADREDRRGVVIALTMEGESRVREALDLRGAHFFDRTAGWSTEELRRFVALLHAFNSPRMRAGQPPS